MIKYIKRDELLKMIFNERIPCENPNKIPYIVSLKDLLDFDEYDDLCKVDLIIKSGFLDTDASFRYVILPLCKYIRNYLDNRKRYAEKLYESAIIAKFGAISSVGERCNNLLQAIEIIITELKDVTTVYHITKSPSENASVLMNDIVPVVDYALARNSDAFFTMANEYFLKCCRELVQYMKDTEPEYYPEKGDISVVISKPFNSRQMNEYDRRGYIQVGWIGSLRDPDCVVYGVDTLINRERHKNMEALFDYYNITKGAWFH